MSYKSEFNSVFQVALENLRKRVPRDTGHLADKSTKGRWLSSNHFQIVIDRDILMNVPNARGKVAGYYYAGRLNNDHAYRTYGFWKKEAQKLAQEIASSKGGKIRK